MKGFAIFVAVLLAVQGSVWAQTQKSCDGPVVVSPPTTCGPIPYISDLSQACASQTKNYASGLVVTIVATLTSIKTCEISSDVKILTSNLTVYVNALIVQVSAGLRLILAAVKTDLITIDLQASINKCHSAISIILGFAGSPDISVSVLISALIDVGKVVKDLVCDVNTVVKALSVNVLLTEVIVALVVILYAVVFVVNLVVVQLTVFLGVAVTAVVKLLTGTLLQASTGCGALVVKVTSCVSTGSSPVSVILADLAALIVVLLAGVKLLLNSVLGLLGGLFLSDAAAPQC